MQDRLLKRLVADEFERRPGVTAVEDRTAGGA
jgi:hypothetical protein